jgi:hypothetical protein
MKARSALQVEAVVRYSRDVPGAQEEAILSRRIACGAALSRALSLRRCACSSRWSAALAFLGHPDPPSQVSRSWTLLLPISMMVAVAVMKKT